MDNKAAAQKLIAAVAAGEEANFSTGDSAQDDPTQGDAWGEERSIPAELIVELCTGRHSQPDTARNSVRLRSVKVTGSLDLTGKAVQCPLSLIGCWFSEQILLTDSTTKTISFQGSHICGIQANRVSVEGGGLSS